MFLDKPELKSIAPLDIVNLITDNDSDIVKTIIEESIDVIKTYISGNYDTDWLFSKTGNERSKTLVKTLKNIAIYEIYCRRCKMLNEVIERRYSDSIRFLEQVSQGKIQPQDWIKPVDNGEDSDSDSPFLFVTGKKKYPTSF